MTVEQPYQEWLGRTEECVDIVLEAPLRKLAALLDRGDWPWRAALLPPLGHWLFHTAATPQSALGDDGHARRAGLLPPIELPRRMWAGSRIRFHHDIPVGAQMIRRSTVAAITRKNEKVFITLQHEIVCGGRTALTEEQDIVYLGLPRAPAHPANAPEPMPQPDAVRRVVVDTVQLFRFSALTFNAHRIHYDRDYAVRVEGYPGLVVHGPLVATMLLDHLLSMQPGARMQTFDFRARAPVFDGVPFELCVAQGRSEADLWARTAEGLTLMSAKASFDADEPDR
jgi:3-methylfumaryl-CoA hydratase